MKTGIHKTAALKPPREPAGGFLAPRPRVPQTAVIPALAVIGILCACSGLSARSLGRYVPGDYEGTAPGFRGRVRAAVQVDENGIAGISLSHEDDEEIGGAAMRELLELVLEAGSTDDIDAVSGATESSLAFLAAVDNALDKARAP